MWRKPLIWTSTNAGSCQRSSKTTTVRLFAFLWFFTYLTMLYLFHQCGFQISDYTQLFTWHLPLCLKSWLYLWQTSYLLWPNYISLSFIFSDQLTSLSKACYYHIRQLCCIRPYLRSTPDLATEHCPLANTCFPFHWG